MKNTIVISAFPACGKSYCFNHYQDSLSMLDSDSSEFSWLKDAEGKNTKERNPDFPQNYIEHIKKNLGAVDVIFVSSHEVVRRALAQNNIKTLMVYPAVHLKDEWLRRFRARGNHESFIDFISSNWDQFIADIDNEDHGFIKMKLKDENDYISLAFLQEYINRLTSK